MKLPADDITGEVGTELIEMKVTIDGETKVLDLTDRSLAAIKALGTPEGPNLFRGLFIAVKESNDTTGPTTDTEAIRQWAKEQTDGEGNPRWDIKEKGNLKKEVLQAYADAHPTL